MQVIIILIKRCKWFLRNSQMAEEKSEKGWLSKAFWGAVKICTVVLAANVAWQLLLDPLFFTPIHDPMNETAQAFVGWVQDKFGWIPDMTGMTGNGGLLHTDFAQGVLAPYYKQVAVAKPAMIHQTFSPATGGLDLDDLSP
jgi:hypothetical protein